MKKGPWLNSSYHCAAPGSSSNSMKGLGNWEKIFQLRQNQRPLFISRTKTPKNVHLKALLYLELRLQLLRRIGVADHLLSRTYFPLERIPKAEVQEQIGEKCDWRHSIHSNIWKLSRKTLFSSTYYGVLHVL